MQVNLLFKASLHAPCCSPHTLAHKLWASTCEFPVCLCILKEMISLGVLLFELSVYTVVASMITLSSRECYVHKRQGHCGFETRRTYRTHCSFFCWSLKEGKPLFKLKIASVQACLEQRWKQPLLFETSPYGEQGKINVGFATYWISTHRHLHIPKRTHAPKRNWRILVSKSFFGIILLHQLHFCLGNECICFHNDMEEKKMAFHAGTRIDCVEEEVEGIMCFYGQPFFGFSCGANSTCSTVTAA